MKFKAFEIKKMGKTEFSILTFDLSNTYLRLSVLNRVNRTLPIHKE